MPLSVARQPFSPRKADKILPGARMVFTKMKRLKMKIG